MNNYDEILKKLTLEEKIALLSGKDFWHLRGNERLSIPELMITDGPHGLRKQDPKGKGGLGSSVPTTCFPTASATACSFDRELLFEMGQAIGEECLEEKVSVILGPGINIKRSPLGGRNFEYFSEDPVLAGEMGASLIGGIQSKNVGTSIKHFAMNSQEKRRMTVDSIVDERTLREIYLTAFEIAVKKAKPWTVMNAYNRLNGIYCSDNDYLQNKILRDEWGFEGVVVTDWGAANDRAVGLKNGNDLEMPTSNGYNDEKIAKAVREGKLDEKYVDLAARRMLELIEKGENALCDFKYDRDAHHNLAKKVAEGSVVLLKNDENILPLKKGQTVAVIGEMARAPRYQGAGSSVINPTKLSDAFSSLMGKGINLLYAPGYDKKKDEVNDTMFADARLIASRADVCLVFAGLTENYESEGFDRENMELPFSHNALIEEIASVNKNTVVVLSGGAPVEMPWIEKVKGLLNIYLSGQASGEAAAEILLGEVSPSGKLAETYPKKLSDTPCYNFFPGKEKTAEHREGIFVGYRYYDTAKKEVLFPFGYGLSYTKFEYSNLKLSSKKIKDTDTLTVSLKVKNVGDMRGGEIVQLYVKDTESTIFRPEKELKDFGKVFLEPKEEKEISFVLSKRAFAYYNTKLKDWHIESGKFEILLCSSSKDIQLKGEVEVESTIEAEVPNYKNTASSYYTADIQNISDREYESVLGFSIPNPLPEPDEKLTLTSSLYDARYTKWGSKINSMVEKALSAVSSGDPSTVNMMKAMALEIPIRNFVTMSGGAFSEEMAIGLIEILNGEKAGKGLLKILSGVGNLIKSIPSLMKLI